MSPQVARARATAALAVALVAAAVSMTVALLVWQTASSKRSDRLCGVLYGLVSRSGASVGSPGSPGYSYYHTHPAELQAARKQNRDFLNMLPCHQKGVVP